MNVETTTSQEYRMLTEKVVEEYVNNEPPLDLATTYLLGIFSTNSKTELMRREILRKTYLDDDRMCSLTAYMKHSKLVKGSIVKKCTIPYAFIVAANEDRPTEHNDNEPLTIEPSDIEGGAEPDVVYLNIKENMEDGKSVTYFKFGQSIAEEYGIDFIGKADSDTIISVDLLENFIRNDLPPKPHNRRMYGGVLWGHQKTNTLYAPGAFYFMSVDLAHYISVLISPETRKKLTNPIPCEDMDIGRFVFSHPRPIKFVNLSSYNIWIHSVKTEEQLMKAWEGKMWQLPRNGGTMGLTAICKH